MFFKLILAEKKLVIKNKLVIEKLVIGLLGRAPLYLRSAAALCADEKTKIEGAVSKSKGENAGGCRLRLSSEGASQGSPNTRM